MPARQVGRVPACPVDASLVQSLARGHHPTSCVAGAVGPSGSLGRYPLDLPSRRGIVQLSLGQGQHMPRDALSPAADNETNCKSRFCQTDECVLGSRGAELLLL